MKQKDYYSRLNITTATYPLYTLLNDIRNCSANGLDISPDYQRGYIWSNEYKDKLLLSLILNYPIGNIVINQLQIPNEKNAKQELVDGKQRLTTVMKFVEGKYTIKSSELDEIKGTVNKIINNPESKEIQNMNKKRALKYNDLPQVIRDNILAYNIPLYTIQSADTFQIREYFKVLQNQEKLRAGEIINSMPDNILEEYFLEIGNGFLEKISYIRLKRAEFEKIYYSVLGMCFDKLPLNSPDKSIIKFVERLESLTEQEKIMIKYLNENLNYIKNMESNIFIKGMNKRTLKLILCVAAVIPEFFKEKTNEKVLYIINLSAKLAAFNSSSSDENSFKKYFGEEFTKNTQDFLNDRANKYRTIYEVSNRAVRKNNVELAMNMLAELYNR